MPVSSDGTKLLARGVTVILADGVPRQLILDMEALVVIEERVGSLVEYNEGLLHGVRGKVIRSLLAGLVGGLSHLEGEEALSSRQISRLVKIEKWPDLQGYIDVLDEAWAEHLPSSKKGQAPGKGSGAASSSRGRKSTGASRSTTAAATGSSGA